MKCKIKVGKTTSKTDTEWPKLYQGKTSKCVYFFYSPWHGYKLHRGNKTFSPVGQFIEIGKDVRENKYYELYIGKLVLSN